MEQLIQTAADALWVAASSRVSVDPVRNIIGAEDVDAAYEVQNLNTEKELSLGRRIVGRKIGLTSLAVQKQLGVDRPDFGVLFDNMIAGEGLPIDPSLLMSPKIEAEIALVLSEDLANGPVTIADVIRATDYVLPALEIVASRIRNWDIRITDTVADNASSGMFVLGGPARRIQDIDLRSASMEMRRGDEVVSKGSGAACLGHPLNAACWLANELLRRGQMLRKGDIVLTGALGPMVPVNPGDEFVAEIEGLGRVSALFGNGG